jgi:hypothetical protein
VATDGIFRDETASPPAPDGSISRMTPFTTARLSEAQIQQLLATSSMKVGSPRHATRTRTT